MNNSEIEEFGKVLVERVRDQAIRDCNRDLEPDSASVVANRWKNILSETEGIELIRSLIPDIVDAAIARLLIEIDQELLNLFYKANNGKNIDLINDGESQLCGAYGGEWVKKYTKEKFYDDFSDMENMF